MTQNSVTRIRLKDGEVSIRQMTLEALFGPLSPHSERDPRLSFVGLDVNGIAVYSFDGTQEDWRFTLLEISIGERLTGLSLDLNHQLEAIYDQVNKIRYALSVLMDPQRQAPNDRK